MVKKLKSSLLSLKQLSERIKSEEISPVDLIEVCLDRIKKINPILNAFITVIEKENLYNQSQIAEREIKKGNYYGLFMAFHSQLKIYSMLKVFDAQ